MESRFIKQNKQDYRIDDEVLKSGLRSSVTVNW